MGYDYSSAIKAGLTDSQIAEFLSQEYGNYNIEAARQAGLSDTQIAQFLSQYKPEQEEDKNFFDHVGDFLGGVGTGIVSTPLLFAEGAAGQAYAIAPDLFPSIEESGVVESSREARQDVQAFFGGDAQSDAYGVGNALGSFATFLIPGVGGAALAAKGLTTAGRVVGWGGGGTLAVGAGAGEQVESILAANKRLGEEIPDLDKRLSILMGGAVGLTELASLRLPLGLIASKLPKNLVTKPMADSILKKVGNVFLAGGAEGAQEAIAGVLQDLISKNMYDPNLEIGESWASDFGYGASAGVIFQGILQATIGRRRPKGLGQIDTVIGDPKDTVVAEDAPETTNPFLEESRRLKQPALPAPPPVPLQIEDHSIDSDRVMEPDADISSIAQRTVDQLAGDLPVAFTNGQIALDTDGMPASYEVASGDKGPYVKTRAGIKVSPYFATVEQAETFKDEMNAGVFDIMRMHDQVEQDTLAREALKEAKIEETEATLDAARKTYLPAAIEFDTLPSEVAGQINIHNSMVGKNTKVRGDVVSISEMADANISQDIIDGLLPGAMNTGTIEGVRETASQKNIIIDSEASSQTGTHDDGFVRFIYRLTGGKDLNRMSGAQLATIQMKLDELSSFSQPTSLPTIRQPDFTPSQYATVIAMARDMPRRTVGKKSGRVLEKGEFQKSDINNVLDKTGEPTGQIIERALRRGDIRHATNARGKQRRGVYRYNRPAPVKTPLQRGELIEAQERARAQEEGTISPLRGRLLRGGSIETTGEGAVAPKSGILVRRSDTDSKLTSEQAAQEMKNRASRARAIPQFKQRMENLGGREAINKALGRTLRLFQNKIPALKNVPLAVRYVNTLTEEGAKETKEGMIRQTTDDKQVIVLALDALEDNQDGSLPSREQALKQLSSVMSHEIIHVLRNTGIITKADWKVLTNFVETNNAVTREGGKLDKTWFDEISEVYKGQSLTQEELVEEAVAEAFRAYADGVMKVVGKPRNLFNRIADFFIAMRRGFKKINVLSAADVFGKYAPVPVSTEFVPAGVTPTQEQVVTAQETRERLGQHEVDAPITQFSIKRERVRPRDTAFTAFNEGNNNLTLNGRPIPPKGKVRRLSAVDILYNDALAPRSGMSVPFAAEFLDMKGLRVHKKPILIEKNQSQDNLISDVLALEAKAALQYGDNASGWYSEKIQEALEKASRMYPEIKTNPDAKFAFFVSLAVTSQKTNVILNTKYADEVYSYFRENGKFPPNYGKGESSKSMRDNFSLLNSLIERFDNQGGISEVHQLFNEEFTVKQLTEEGFNFPVPKQEGMGETVFGSYLLGAKIGQGFYQNLNGNFNPITIDMWLMRTFGRLTGRLVGNPGAFPKQQERLFKALIERGDRELIGRMREAVEAKDTDAIIELAGELRLENERIFKTPEVQKEYKKNPKKWSKEKKPEWAKAAQALYDGQIKPKDNPFGSGYRKSVRRIMNKTKEKLSRDGIEVTNADLQAILWYPEKNLYAKLGAKVKDLNTDYSQAFDLLLEGREVLNEAEANLRTLERGTTRQGIDADTRGTGRDRGEVDEKETPSQYSIARPTAKTPINESALINIIKQNPEGFTVRVDGSAPLKAGFVVAPIKAAEIRIEENFLDDKTIREFAKTLLAVTDSTEQEVYAGGWLHEGTYYLDAVHIYDTLDTALYVADSGKQKAIWDLGELNEVTTSEEIERLKQSGAYSDKARNDVRRSGEESSQRFNEIRHSGRWATIREEAVATGRVAGLDREADDRGRPYGRTGREDDLRRIYVGADELTGDGKKTTAFFAKVTQGIKGRPTTGQAYKPVITLSDELGFDAEYKSRLGNFDLHIATSIPGFREAQAAIGEALVKSYGDGADMLDIGASEGALNKTISSRSDGNIRTLGVDPNTAMAETFRSGNPVEGAGYEIAAFGAAEQEGQIAWQEKDGTTIRYYRPDRKFDAVHEAMVFQFISKDREPQIRRMKEMAKPDGLVIIEEKVFDDAKETRNQWNKNESKKDKFKEQYFVKADITKKREETLVGMHENMISTAETENILASNFRAVAQFWDSGNFKGYVASDSADALNRFLSNLQPLESNFATVKTPRRVTRTTAQYSFKRREVESKDVQKRHLSETESWFSRLAKELGYSRIPADAFKIEHLVTPQLKNDASLIWNGRAWPVIIHRGVNKKIEGRDKGFGLIHANRHRAEIVENTPANSVSDFVEIVMGAYWPHRDGQARGQQVDDQAKNFQLLRQENGLIKLRWDNPEWKYPSTLIFREVPFNMFSNVVSARPELKGRGYMALVTAFPNNANKKDVTRPMDSPIINPNASVAATQAANESIAGENPNSKRETLKLRKQYSLKRRYAQLPPEEKALHKKIIGGSPPDQTLGEKVLGIGGLDKYNPNNPWGRGTYFRHHLVDKWASVFKTEKLVQKKRREEGLDHDIATDSAASAAFALLDRASGIISGILTVGPPIYDRGRVYAINSDSLKVSAAAGKHQDAVRAEYQRAMDRLIEESAYQEIVVDPVTGEQTTKQIRWENADEVEGLLDILNPLESKGLLESFLLYSIGKRAQRFNAEGREKTLTDADIEAALAIGEKDPAIKQAHRKYQLWNNSVVNMMVDAGVISQDMATLWKQNADYLPFYRELYEDAGVAYQLVSGEGTPTKDVLYKTLDDNRNNKMFQSFWQTKQPRELKGGKPVYWVMVNDVADSGRYTSRDSKQLQDRLQALKELNPRANVRIAVDNQRIADPLNNILQNASAAVTASMQNIAVSRAIRDMLYLNLAASIPEDNREPHPNRLGVRIKGETKWFEVQDSMLVNALRATGDVNMPFLELQAAPARFLREMVTKDPSFMAANMLRDTLSSWVTSGIKVRPVIGTLKGYGEALMGSSSAKALISSGVVGGYEFKGDSKNVMQAFRKHQKLKSPVRHPFISMWNTLDNISGASDSSTRIAVYNRVLKETGDETRAIVEALEIINFSRKGAHSSMRYLTAVVPFLNARIQGLDVLYRGAKGDIGSVDQAKRRKRFYFRALTIVSLTAAYHMAQNRGDEEDNPWYHNAPEHVKDNYWIIPPTWFGGTRDSSAFRMPIPFEVGVLFKVIPERIMQLIEGSTDGREIGSASWRHLTTTFNVSFPQWFQPAFEAMMNKNWYTGREIVTYWQGRNESWMANPDYASPAAIALSEALDENLELRVDAEKIDHVVRGYIGTLGSYALMLGDSVSRKAIGLPERAARSIYEEPVIGRFLQESEGKGPLHTFYDLKTELDIFVETLNSLIEGGDLNRADKYQLSRLNLAMHQPVIEALREEIVALRAFRKQLVNDRSLTPEERRDSVRGVDTQINELLHSHNIKKLRTEALTRQ